MRNHLIKNVTAIALIMVLLNVGGYACLSEPVFKNELNKLFVELNQLVDIQDETPSAQTNAKLKELAQRRIINRWDLDGTLLMMIGRTLWQDLAPQQQAQLRVAFGETLLRYFLEAYEYYDKQKVSVDGLVLNDTKDKGWLRLSVDVGLTNLPVELNVVEHDGLWQLRDLKFQGISYTRMKRHYYQTIIQQQGVDVLIADLDSKNKAYFKNLGLAVHSAQ